MFFRIYFVFESGRRRYKYKKLPQGWASSAAAFHSRIESLLSSIEAIFYVDDELIRGKTQWEHDKQARKVMVKLAKQACMSMPEKFNVVKRKLYSLGMTLLPVVLVWIHTFKNKKESYQR